MKVSHILIYFAVVSLFSVPASADLNIQGASVIQTKDKLIWGLDWSPDGNSIAYVAYDESNRQQIFTINADGTGKRQVTNDINKKWGVAWFEDDISFISYDTDGLEKIFLVKPDGTGLRKLLDDKTRQGRAPEEPPIVGGASWNPKTKTILFTSFDTAGDEKIYQVNLDGTGKKQVITDELRQWNPQWSPDGESFVYISYDNKYIEQLFTANADGSGIKQITFDDFKKSDPEWGQDGILFVSYETRTSSGTKIFIINPDGSGNKLLVKDGFKMENPRWSRDGTGILYVDIDTQGNQIIRALTVTATPSPTVSLTATPALTQPTGVKTPEIEGTPPESTFKDVVFSLFLVLVIIVLVMLGILAISNILSKKK